MNLLAAFNQLDKLYEDINSTEVATWVALPEYLKDILDNSTLLTSDNSARRRSSGLYDPRGNHICFSTDHLNPANVLQKFNFGLLFDRADLENYCEKNQANLGIKQVEEAEINWLTRHTDFAKNLAISDQELSKSLSGGIYVLGLLETVSNKKFIKFLNWERPIQIHDNNSIERSFWDTLVDIFTTYGKDHSFWLVDENSSEEDKTQLNGNYTKIYCVKPTNKFRGVKILADKYRSSEIYPEECPRIYSAANSSDLQILAPGSDTVLATITDDSVKAHLVDNVTQEEEFRLYFNDGIQDFKFDPSLIKKIYIPSAYFISDERHHNVANNFLDLELLYAMFRHNNNFSAHANDPNTIFKYVYNNLDKFDPTGIKNNISQKTAKANFDYNYNYLKHHTELSMQNVYWALRLGVFKFPVVSKLTDTRAAAIVNAVKTIMDQKNVFLEIFKIIKDKYPQARIEFYKRALNDDDVSAHVELDQDAIDRINNDTSDHSFALSKNRSIYTNRIKNRYMNI